MATDEVVKPVELLRVVDAMVTEFESLPAREDVGYGAEKALRSVQLAFPVLDGFRFVGMVTTADSIRAASELNGNAPIASVAHAVGRTAAPGDAVAAALSGLQGVDEEVLPVLEKDRLVGLLVPSKVLELAARRGAR